MNIPAPRMHPPAMMRHMLSLASCLVLLKNVGSYSDKIVSIIIDDAAAAKNIFSMMKLSNENCADMF